MSSNRELALSLAVQLAQSRSDTSAILLATEFFNFLEPQVPGTVPAETPAAKPRTRKAAADPTPAVTPTAETVTAPVQMGQVATTPVSPPVTTPPVVSPSSATVKQVANAIEALAIAKGRDVALGVLTPFGVERVSMLKPEQLGAARAAAWTASAAPVSAAAASVGSLV